MLDLAHPVQKIFLHRNHGQTLSVLNEARLTDRPDPSTELWVVPIWRTVATDGSGLPGLIESIQNHAAYLHQSGEWFTRERTRLSAEFDLFILQTLMERFRASVSEPTLEQVMDSIQKRKLSPREAANVLLK
jgi:putative protein kinase ArgK-like GTPase of G3E family